MLACLRGSSSPGLPSSPIHFSRKVCDAVMKTKKARLPGAASTPNSISNIATSTPFKCPVVPTPTRSAFAPISASRVGSTQSSSGPVRSFRSLFRPSNEHSLSGTPTGTMSSEETAYCQANASMTLTTPSANNSSPPLTTSTGFRSRTAKESRSWRSKKANRHVPLSESLPSHAFAARQSQFNSSQSSSRVAQESGWNAKERLETSYGTSIEAPDVPLSSSIPSHRPNALPAGRYDPLPALPTDHAHQYHVLARTPGAAEFRGESMLSNLERTNSASCELLDSKDLNISDYTKAVSSIRKSLRRKSHIFKKNDDEKKPQQVSSQQQQTDDNVRRVPSLEGCLYKKSSAALGRDWKKKYVVIEESKMVVYQNKNEYLNNGRGKEVNLILTTVKIPGQVRAGRNSLIMERTSRDPTVAPNVNAPNRRRTPSESGEAATVSTQLSDAGQRSGQETTPGSFVRGREVGRASSRRRRRAKSGSKFADPNAGYDSDGYEFLVVSAENKQWHFEADTRETRDTWVAALEKAITTGLGQRLAEATSIGGGSTNQNGTSSRGSTQGAESIIRQLRAVAGNSQCADCGAPEPKWASLNLGVVICIQCSGVHRRLGSHITRIRSMELDDWSEANLAVMRSIGNTLANSVWEAAAGPGGKKKPIIGSSDEEKSSWIRAKYEQRDFLPPVPYADAPLQQQLVDAITRADTRQLVLCLAKAPADCLNEPYSRQDSRRAIHIAATLGHLPYLQLLLWYNADITVTDAEGRNAYFYAIASGQPDCAQFLLSNGCPAEALHHNRPAGGSTD